MKVQELPLPGCYQITPFAQLDDRGCFSKPFDGQMLQQAGLYFEVREIFYNISHANSLRGMHFQRPPHQQTKLVHCLQGQILDVLLDLRRGSPSFGNSYNITLQASSPSALYLPPGIAHGFLALQDYSIVLYAVSAGYAPQHDCGIRWDSFGFKWPISCPTLSERDQKFPPFTHTESYFE
jgi:dTDP-4-dehydrorhamnose 3,5-epimerase